MKTTVIKITRLEIENNRGQKLQLDPDEALALADKLPAILVDMGIDTDIKRQAAALETICPWCGGRKKPDHHICKKCAAALDDGIHTEIAQAKHKHSMDEAAYHAAVKEIWKREAAR
jgi:hypothetical protein